MYTNDIFFIENQNVHLLSDTLYPVRVANNTMSLVVPPHSTVLMTGRSALTGEIAILKEETAADGSRIYRLMDSVYANLSPGFRAGAYYYYDYKDH